MVRARYLVVLLVALTYTTTPPAAPPAAPKTPNLQLVVTHHVRAMIPNGWEVQLIESPDAHRVGFQASASLKEWAATKGKAQGIEAYWVDAAEVGVPSDYYYLAARGPVMEQVIARRGCSSEARQVLLDERPRFDRRIASTGNYVATATGTCRQKGNDTRWASFVAAPGFGPVREVGIPQSGLYYVLVVVRDGPRAERRMERLLSSVSFGGTPVAGFLTAAGGRSQLL